MNSYYIYGNEWDKCYYQTLLANPSKKGSGAWLFVIFLLIGTMSAGCSTSRTNKKGSVNGGDSHFLMECGGTCEAGLSCICGVCTRVCESDEACDDLPGNATCIHPDRLNAVRECQSFEAVDESVCDVECESDNDCRDFGGDAKCQSGFCRFSEAKPLTEEPGADAGTGEASEAETIDASEISISAIDAGQDVSQPNTTDAQEASVVIDASIDASKPVLILPDPPPEVDASDFTATSTYVELVMSSGLPPGERAPTPGEVPANAYGAPQPVPRILNEMWMPLWCWSVASGSEGLCPNTCVGYTLCTVDCDVDSDCDDGGSGQAVPRCNPEKYCELVCEDNSDCPDGMACVVDPLSGTINPYKICYWPYDIAKPGCPAWCELDPLPMGCPGWCAIAGVGCDPEQQGYCCQGLICSEKGWCVEEEQ